jgi:hypothetical protein
MPPLVKVNPDKTELDVSPLLNVIAEAPIGGFIIVAFGPLALVNNAGLLLKLMAS